MPLGDVQDDRSRLEQDKPLVFIGGNLSEGVQRQMRRLFHRLERHQTHLVRLAHFLQRPAHARIARQTLATIRRVFESGDSDGHQLFSARIFPAFAQLSHKNMKR